jgi:hypothetical protein
LFEAEDDVLSKIASALAATIEGDFSFTFSQDRPWAGYAYRQVGETTWEDEEIGRWWELVPSVALKVQAEFYLNIIREAREQLRKRSGSIGKAKSLLFSV